MKSLPLGFERNKLEVNLTRNLVRLETHLKRNKKGLQLLEDVEIVMNRILELHTYREDAQEWKDHFSKTFFKEIIDFQ